MNKILKFKTTPTVDKIIMAFIYLSLIGLLLVATQLLEQKSEERRSRDAYLHHKIRENTEQIQQLQQVKQKTNLDTIYLK